MTLAPGSRRCTQRSDSKPAGQRPGCQRAPKSSDPQPGGGAPRSSLPAWLASPPLALVLVYYGLCSSSLIVINKVAVHTLHAPNAILLAQFAFTGVVVRLAAALALLEAEPLRWKLVRPFLLVAASVLGTIFSNMKVLQHTNVETFITFRSSTPLVLCWVDWAFLKRQLPDARGVGLLLLMVASCSGYTIYDAGFRIEAYTWLAVWYFFFVTDAAWIKYTCDTIPMTSWGRVYYTNTLCALALALAFPFCTSEHAALRAPGVLTPPRIALLLLSCVVGCGMSHASFLLRSAVSATAATVVGIVCKLGSVLLNLLIWDLHANPAQLAFLLLGLTGGSLYRQAPLREPPGEGEGEGGGAVKGVPGRLPLAAQDAHVEAVELAAAAEAGAAGPQPHRPELASRGGL